MTTPRSALLLCVSAGLASSCVSAWEEPQPATPQRPTLSSDTSTTAAGTVELEGGIAADPGDVFETPATLKYGVDARTEAFLGFTPVRWVDHGDDDSVGVGDVVLGGRHRFWVGEQGTSSAGQLALKLPTADEDEGLGTGEFDLLGAAILSHPYDERTSFTGYYELGILGDPDDSDEEVQHAVALAAARGVAPGTSAFGELAQVFGPDDEDPVFTTFGLAWSVVPSVVLDLGLVVGLNDDAPELQLVGGFTTNFGRPILR